MGNGREAGGGRGCLWGLLGGVGGVRTGADEAGWGAAQGRDGHAGQTGNAIGALSFLERGGGEVVVMAPVMSAVGSVAPVSIFDGGCGEGGERGCRAGWGAAVLDEEKTRVRRSA